MTDPLPVPAPPPVPDRATAHRARTAVEQGPNLGRIVLYHIVESPHQPAIVVPAVIQAVREDGTVRLFVFGGGPDLVDDVVMGEGVGQWSWPDAVNAPGSGAGSAPALTALAPDSVALGAPSFTLHVQGAGFTPDSVIVFAGHDEPTTLVSPTEVTTGVDMSLWLGADAVPVTVRNGDGAPSAPLTFTFTAAPAREAESRRRARE